MKSHFLSFAAVTLVSGSLGCESNTAPVLIAPPTFTFTTDTATPLTGTLAFTADRPVRLTVETELVGNDDTWTQSFTGEAATWSVPMLHFAAGERHRLRVRTTDALGRVSVTSLEITAPALPENFPPLTTQIEDAAAVEPGMVVFAVPPTNNTRPSHVVALDERGRVVWFHRTMARISDVAPTPEGTFLMTVGRTQGVEIDAFGTELRRFHARREASPRAGSTAVATDTFHHELHRREDGSYLALSSEVRDFNSFATSEVDPTPRTSVAHVVGDVLVHFEEDGTIRRELNFFDIFDTSRFGYDSFGSFWDVTYPEAMGTLDWSHANAALYEPETDSYLVSMRHQDAVASIASDGNVRWILGPLNGWTGALAEAVLMPSGEGYTHPYQMHAPRWTSRGTLMLFDNGVGRASPPDAVLPDTERYSRVVEYRINTTDRTVEQVWEYGRERGFELYASIVGDSDELPATGNILGVFGGLLPAENGEAAARIVEVTHTTPPRLVREIVLGDDNPDGTASTIIYRAAHITTLYPSL